MIDRRLFAIALMFALATGGSVLAGSESAEDARLLTSYRLLIPVAGVSRVDLHDSFNERRGASPHEAIDIAAPRGTTVVAAGDGRIAKLFKSAPGGLTVYQFDPDQNFAYYYAHLDRYAEGLAEGKTLKRGEPLGYVGSTGNASPASPHLHFAIFRLGPGRRWWEGTPINPYPFLNEAMR